MAALISLGLFVALMTADFRLRISPLRETGAESMSNSEGLPLGDRDSRMKRSEDVPGPLVSLIRQIGEQLPISPQDARRREA